MHLLSKDSVRIWINNVMVYLNQEICQINLLIIMMKQSKLVKNGVKLHNKLIAYDGLLK
jgi:hypothetical protein